MGATPGGRRATIIIFIVGALLLTLFAGLFVVVLQAKRIMERPINPLAKIDAMKNLPRFPTATYDEVASRSQLLTEPILKQATGATKISSIGYSTIMPPAKVIAFYDLAMPQAGYRPDSSTDLSKFFREAQARQYRKGDEVVIVQTQSRTQMERDTLLLVFCLSGIK